MNVVKYRKVSMFAGLHPVLLAVLVGKPVKA